MLLLDVFKTKDPPILTMDDMRSNVIEIDQISDLLESDKERVEVSSNKIYFI